MNKIMLPKMLKAVGLDGPQGLSHALDEVFKNQSMTEGNYIFYQMGNQLSLLRVDFSQKPCQIWYCDSDHRPATAAVKKIIDEFLVNKFGQAGISGKLFHDLYTLQDKSFVIQASQLSGASGSLGAIEERLQKAYVRLEIARHSPAQRFGLFAPKSIADEHPHKPQGPKSK